MANSGKRSVARVVVLDAARSILLVRYARESDSARLWVPPGGALEPGEDHRAAASRELLEETGLKREIGRLLWERRFEFELGGEPVDQTERYFLVRVAATAPPVRNTSSEDIREHRWWSIEDLRYTVDTIYPEGLLEELRMLLEAETG